MRPASLKEQSSRWTRLKLWMASASLRLPTAALEPLYLLFGRPVFGRGASELMDKIRAPSHWSVGGRELMATFVAALFQCKFCTASHGAIASYALKGEFDDAEDLVAAIKRDWRQAPLNPEFKAAFGLLEKLILEPREVTSADVQPLRDAGLDDEAILDAIYVGVAFTLATCTADAFDFALPDEDELQAHVGLLLKSPGIRKLLMR